MICVQRLRQTCGEANITWLTAQRDGSGQIHRILVASDPSKSNFVISRDFREFNESNPNERVKFVVSLLGDQVPQHFFSTVVNGIWFFRFGEGDFDGESFGIRELWRGNRTQEVSLEKISGHPDERHILKKGIFKSHLRSLRNHRTAILAQCSDWPAMLAEELSHRNSTELETEVTTRKQTSFRPQLFGRLIGLIMLPLLFSTGVLAFGEG